MAISGANVASVFSGTDATSYATASYTPTANRLLLAYVENAKSTGTPDTPTLSGNGLTWTQVATFVPDTAVTQFRMSLFVAKSGGSPSAGAVTADFGGLTQLGCSIIVDEFDGADISGTALAAIVQNKTGAVDSGSATSETVTLDSAIGSGNATYGAFLHQAVETSTPGSGYTTLLTSSHSSPSSGSITEFRAAGQTTVDASWTTSQAHGGIAAEIKAASTSDYPQVAATAGYAQATPSTSHPVTLPSGIVAGNLLLVFVTTENDTFGWPAGWTQFFAHGGGAGENRLEGRYRIADGSEGSTITVTIGGSRRVCGRSFRITGQHSSSVPEAATGVLQAGNVSPDPPSLDPSWGTEATLWFAVSSYNANDNSSGNDRTVSSYPSSYTDGVNDHDNTGVAVALGIARRENTVAAEDPGTFTLTGTGLGTVSNVVTTVGVRPAVEAPPIAKAASDTLSVGITDTSSVIANIAKAASDTLTVGVTDSGAVVATTPPVAPALPPPQPLPETIWTIDDIPVPIRDWSANARRHHGYDQMRGTLMAEDARHLPASVKQGSRVKGWTLNRRKFWDGKLSAPPTFQGGLATIAAQGDAIGLEKSNDRFLAQSRDVGSWFDRMSPPVSSTATTPSSLSMQIDSGRIVWAENVGAPSHPGGGAAHMAAVWWSPGEALRRIQGTYRIHGPSSSWELKVYSFDAPADTGFVLRVGIPLTGSGDVNFSHIFALPYPEAILLQLEWVGASITFGGNYVIVRNLRVNGPPTESDTLTAGEVALSVAQEAGLRATLGEEILSTSENILPLDWEGSRHELMTHLALMEDVNWGLYEDAIRFQRWGANPASGRFANKEWTVYQADGAVVDLDDKEIYSGVVVRYIDVGGSRREVKATADPDEGGGNYFPIDLPDVQPDSTVPETLAQKWLPYLSHLRSAGTINAVRAYDAVGRDAPFEVFPGHTVRVADAGKGTQVHRIDDVGWSPRGVSLGIDAPSSPEGLINRLGLARRRAAVDIGVLPEIEVLEAEVPEVPAELTFEERMEAAGYTPERAEALADAPKHKHHGQNHRHVQWGGHAHHGHPHKHA